MTASRRELLQLGALGFGAALVGCPRAPNVPGPSPNDGETPPMLACEPGRLSTVELDDLWKLLVLLARTWEMSLPPREEFSRIVEAKTTRAPSYLAEYRNALVTAKAWAAQVSSSSPLSKVLASASSAPEQHARTYVVSELAAMLIAFGGLASFGTLRLGAQAYMGREYGYHEATTS